MAGYRRVNYYELCRLCTSSEGTKMHIFREEGRRRQLPTKIQICLPVQVCEDDSLPKIICNHCVEKLESFYDFRESCVNAESMLESYFTSLRYSDDFTREGKVYVKEGSPPKKKLSDADTISKHHHKSTLTTSTDGLNSLVQAAGIQIVSDADGTRVQQYKCAMQMQPGNPGATVVEAAATEARYTYEPCGTTSPRPNDGSAGNANNTTNSEVAQVAKVEDGSTQCSETDFKNNIVNRHHQSADSSDEGEVSAQQHHQQPVTFAAAGPGQEMLLHFNFNKEREGILRVEEQAALQSKMGCYWNKKTKRLRKTEAQVTAALVDIERGMSIREVASLMGYSKSSLQRYWTKRKQFNTIDEFQSQRNFVPKIVDHEQELMSENYLIKSSEMFYGLTNEQARKVAYQYALAGKSYNIPETWYQEQMAG